MIDKNTGYYHCLECGALFESEIKDLKDQRCLICGNPPTGKILQEEKELHAPKVNKNKSVQTLSQFGKIDKLNKSTQDIYNAAVGSLEAQQESKNGKVKRSKRRKKKSQKIWIMATFWLLLMVSLIAIKEFVLVDDKENKKIEKVDSNFEKKHQEAENKKKQKIIDGALPLCREKLEGFFNSNTVSEKAQYVYQGAKLIGKMSRYYKDEFIPATQKHRLNFLSSELLDGFAQPAIGALCKSSEGLLYEVIFIQDNKEWRIDWESFVRLDDTSWFKFTSQENGKEGVFRLYMRVRDTNEDLKRSSLSVVFYKPDIVSKNEFEGIASSPANVLIDSDLGRKITNLADLSKEKPREEKVLQDSHGLSIGRIDPSGYHRVKVRLKLHREGKNGKNTRLELLEILANNWYGDFSKKQTH